MIYRRNQNANCSTVTIFEVPKTALHSTFSKEEGVFAKHLGTASRKAFWGSTTVHIWQMPYYFGAYPGAHLGLAKGISGPHHGDLLGSGKGLDLEPY